MSDISNQDSSSEHTPFIKQYLSIKESCEGALLFFRMGDFYELFYEDAEIASKELSIILTSKQTKNHAIPMCGVPYHSYENYLKRLIQAGYKVAICEQVETPTEAKKRGGYKAVLNREVMRIVTPGTITEDSLLSNDKFNYLMAIYIKNKTASCAWTDISTGDFYIESIAKTLLNNIISRVNPKEIVIEEEKRNLISEEFLSKLTFIPKDKFNFISSSKNLEQFFLNSDFSQLTKDQVLISGLLLDYLNITQKQTLKVLRYPKVWNKNGDTMQMDDFTIKSLELNHSNDGSHKGSFKSIIKNTITSLGSRVLNEWLLTPLIKVEPINYRIEVVDFFYNNQEALNKVREILKNIPDIIRLFSRLSLNRGSPRDLGGLAIGLQSIYRLQAELIDNKNIPYLLRKILSIPNDFSPLTDLILRALVTQSLLPNHIKEGGFIRSGYSAELDIVKKNIEQAKLKITDLEQIYTSKLLVSNLRIKYNEMLGFFIEVSSKFAHIILENKEFKHRQTLASSARFDTPELVSISSLLADNQGKVNTLEQQIFIDLISEMLNYQEAISDAGNAIALVDVLSSFAFTAQEYDLVKPVIDDGTQFEVTAGRHLTVETSLREDFERRFTKNNCYMKPGNVFLITGPNMAGKSTFLRQNALIIILAQIGSFVPADYAKIGLVDNIFSRVGSADNLYRNQSTFLLEMVELATILNKATNKSFVILDEIGRGTSTYDGLSIACATVEYLHNVNNAKTLFATHYHELTSLNQSLERLELYNMDTDENKGEVIFKHKVVPGEAKKSYGIYVAKLAGVHPKVLQRARSILNKLESKKANPVDISLPLFDECMLSSANQANSLDDNELEHKEVIKDLQSLSVDELSPREALDFLYTLKVKLGEK